MRSIKCDEIKRSALKEKCINKRMRRNRGRGGAEREGGDGEEAGRGGCVILRTVPLNWVS